MLTFTMARNLNLKLTMDEKPNEIKIKEKYFNQIRDYSNAVLYILSEIHY